MASSQPSSFLQAEGQSTQQEAEFEALTRELAERELELATLENRLLAFEKRYARTVGLLFAELDVLDREIAGELFRLHPEEKYRQGFQRAEQKAQTSQDAIHEEGKQEEKQAYVPTDEIKNLYRKVAKIIHPDLAVNEAERAFRTALMVRANLAYRNGDKQALEQILYEWEHRDETSSFQEEEAKAPDVLERKIAQIKIRLEEIKIKIDDLKKCDLYQLMLRVERADSEGRDLLGDMAKDLQAKVLQARKLLDSLRIQGKE